MNRKTVSVLTVIFLFILVSLTWVFIKSQESIYKAEEEVVDLVSLDHDIDQVNRFYWSTTEEPYFGLDYLDREGQQRYAIVQREGGDVYHYTSQDIISHLDAIAILKSITQPERMIQTRLTLKQDQPTWELTFKTNNQTISYFYINAKTGKWVESLENI